MATRNRIDRTVDTVERLLDLPEGWPVIIVDDASTDGTSQRLSDRFGSRLTVLTLAECHGSGARTLGAEAASSEFVAFADDDSWGEPGALELATKAFDWDPDLALIAATVRVEPSGRLDPIVDAFNDSPLARSALGPEVLGFLACGAVVRRDAFLSVGGFGTLLGVGGEEELLALDLRSAGWRLVHVPEVIAHHAPAVGDGRNDRAVRQARNALIVVWLRRPIRRCIEDTTRMARRALRDPVARRALLGVARVTPQLALLRHRVPCQVEAEVRRLEQWTSERVSRGDPRCLRSTAPEPRASRARG